MKAKAILQAFRTAENSDFKSSEQYADYSDSDSDRDAQKDSVEVPAPARAKAAAIWKRVH